LKSIYSVRSNELRRRGATERGVLALGAASLPSLPQQRVDAGIRIHLF
jgi:hypothetical protein